MFTGVGEDETQGDLDLVAVEQLDARALIDVRAAALELEAHAYEISPTVPTRTMTGPAKTSKVRLALESFARQSLGGLSGFVQLHVENMERIE